MSPRGVRRARRLASTSGAALLLALTPFASAQREVLYRLTDEPGPDGGGGAWRVEVVLRGLEPGAVVGFTSAGWGWPQGKPYLAVVESDPLLAERAEDGTSLTLAALEPSRSEVRLVYRVDVADRGSERQRRNGLMPSRGDGFAFGSSLNTLLRPSVDGELLDGSVTIELVPAEPEATIVTGWSGRARGAQRLTPDTPWGNSFVVFGEPASTTVARAGSLVIEAYQFGNGPDTTERAVDLVRRIAPAVARHTGWPARSPSRVFLSSAMDGGMGTDYGFHLNVPDDAPADHGFDLFFTTTVAHELFHEWLGTRLHESSGSLVWFREGFTEYFSQWLSASLGTISAEDFAETLASYDHFARASTSLGRVAFADPTVEWRDGDGPNELMAYRGGPVLALALDVELRAAGEPGLLQLLRDLLSRDEHVFPPEDLFTWFVDHGLEDAWNRSVAGLDVPAAADSLARAGFVCARVPVDVPYLGLRTIEEKPIWRVLAVDPQGPAARAGVRVGDVIDGFFPFHDAPLELIELDTPYTFGLTLFAPGVEGTFLGIRRGDEKLKLFVDPELRPWGLRPSWSAGEATDAFFAFEPR